MDVIPGVWVSFLADLFFFKQKPAYEMRSSDWSSDVCSSDLPRILGDPPPDTRIRSYDAAGIQYAVRYWVPSFADDIDCRDAVLSAVDAAIRERGLPPPRARFHLAMDGPPRELEAALAAPPSTSVD